LEVISENYGVGVAGCQDLSRDAEHHPILERICDRLETQDVIFIFSKVELM
jgi:hypothetical protein